MNDHYFNHDQLRHLKPNLILRRRHRIRETIITVVMLTVVLILGIQLFNAHRQAAVLHRQIHLEQSEIAQKRSEQRRLKLDVKRLNNRDYLKQLVRQRYYYTKSGETIYNLPGEMAKDVNHN